MLMSFYIHFCIFVPSNTYSHFPALLTGPQCAPHGKASVRACSWSVLSFAWVLTSSTERWGDWDVCDWEWWMAGVRQRVYILGGTLRLLVHLQEWKSWGWGERNAKSKSYTVYFVWVMRCNLKVDASLVDLVGIEVFIFRNYENSGYCFLDF